jgi:hypothetical protein
MNLRKIYQDAKRAVEMTAKQSIEFVKNLFKIKKTLSNSDFKPGSIITFNYNAKDKTQTYDKTPLVMILRRNGSHTLAINFHWAPVSMRVMLINIILKKNKGNIRKGRPLEFSYNELKPLLKRMGFAPIIRKYINNRISSKGAVIPTSELMQAAKLKSETFTKGKMSAGQLYKKATKKYK